MINTYNIVLDTNVVISMLSRKLNFQNILFSLIDGDYNLFVTTEIILEYEEKINSFFNKNQTDTFMRLIDTLPNVHKIQSYYQLNIITADPSDNKFVDCAFSCNAEYIVTNDKHFNILKKIDFPKIRIITIEDFLKIIIIYRPQNMD